MQFWVTWRFPMGPFLDLFEKPDADQVKQELCKGEMLSGIVGFWKSEERGVIEMVGKLSFPEQKAEVTGQYQSPEELILSLQKLPPELIHRFFSTTQKPEQFTPEANSDTDGSKP